MNRREAVRLELESISSELRVIELILGRLRQKPLDEIEIRGAALSLAALYNGIEKTMLHLLAGRGIVVPQSSTWHTEVIQQCQNAEILSEGTAEQLKAFLAFRHFVRHAYTFQIDSATITAVLQEAPSVVNSFAIEARKAIEPSTDH